MTFKYEKRNFTPSYGTTQPNSEVPTPSQVAHIPDRIMLFSPEVAAYKNAKKKGNALEPQSPMKPNSPSK